MIIYCQRTEKNWKKELERKEQDQKLSKSKYRIAQDNKKQSLLFRNVIIPQIMMSLIMIAVTFLISILPVSTKLCGELFPKVIGTDDNNVFGYHMAYNSDTDSLSVLGHSFDRGILGIPTTSSATIPLTGNGFIALLKGTDMHLSWVKGFVESGVVEDRMYHSAFSDTGAYIITSIVNNQNAYILILETATGNIQRIFQKSDYLTFNQRAAPHLLYVDPYCSNCFRGYVFFDTLIPLASVPYPHFTLMKFTFLPNPSTADPIIDWAIDSAQTDTGVDAVSGMVFDISFSFIYAFAKLNGQHMVTRLKANDGLQIWAYNLGSTSTYTDGFTTNIKYYDSKEAIVHCLYSPNNLVLVRIIDETSKTQPDSIKLYKINSVDSSMIIYAILIQTFDILQAFITKDQDLLLYYIDFSSMGAKSRSIIPNVHHSTIMAGVFIAQDRFFALAQLSTFDTGLSGTVNYINQQPFIFSSDPNELCATYAFEHPNSSGINMISTINVNRPSPLIYFFTQVASVSPPSLTDASASSALSINSGASNAPPSWCFNDGTKPQFVIDSLPLGTVSQTFNYIARRQSYVVIIGSLPTLTTTCGANSIPGSTPLSIVYTAKNYYTGNALPSAIAVDSSTGTITISQSQPAGTIRVQIIATLSSFLSTTEILIYLIGSNNSPPQFFSSGLPLQNFTVRVLETNTYILPNYYDSNSGDTVTLSVLAFPRFVTFVSSSKTFTFAPLVIADIGPYNITITLSDGQDQSLYYFQLDIIKAANSAAPTYAINGPVNQKIRQNLVSNYVFPALVDADNDPITIVNQKMPSFCTFSVDTYTFKPFNELGVFEISGYFTDPDYQVHFSFTVEVYNEAPFFQSILIDAQGELGKTTYYTLPTPVDTEEQAIQVKTSGLPSFVNFDPDSLTYTIQPTDKSHVGLYTLDVSLSDSHAPPSTYQFKLKVKNSPLVAPPPIQISLPNTTTTTSQQQNTTIQVSQQQSVQSTDKVTNQQTASVASTAAVGGESSALSISSDPPKRDVANLKAQVLQRMKARNTNSNAKVKDIVIGLLTIDQIYRDQTAVLIIQPLSTSLKNFTNLTMRATLPTQNYKPVKFEVIEKNTGRGEITIKLHFDDIKLISATTESDVLRITLLKSQEMETDDAIIYFEKGLTADKNIPPQLAEGNFFFSLRLIQGLRGWLRRFKMGILSSQIRFIRIYQCKESLPQSSLQCNSNLIFLGIPW